MNAFTKLSNERPLIVNSQENGLLMISRFCFKELMITMTNGNMNAQKTMIIRSIASASVTFFFVPPIFF